MKTKLHPAKNDLRENGSTCDADTEDLSRDVSRGVGKLLWLAEAHAQSKE